jgi:hypothetical protein
MQLEEIQLVVEDIAFHLRHTTLHIRINKRKDGDTGMKFRDKRL